MTTALLLSDLNFRREAAGLKPLKTWKASRAALEDAIAKLPPAVPRAEEPTGNDADGTAGGEPPSPPTPPAGSASRVKRQPKRDDATRLTVIARASGKSEKVMRAKARRWQSKLRPFTVDPTIEDWTFWNKNLPSVCKILGVQVPAMQNSVPTDETKPA